MKIPTKIELVNFINNNRFLNSNFVFNFIASIIIFIISLAPVWAYFLIRWFIAPQGFWQEFAIFVVASILMGWLQIILIILGGTIVLQLFIE